MKRTTSSKEIVLGVTGSIAAYKACEIASRLVESGYAVTPALTASAQELVGPATFEALTGRRVITGMLIPSRARRSSTSRWRSVPPCF